MKTKSPLPTILQFVVPVPEFARSQGVLHAEPGRRGTLLREFRNCVDARPDADALERAWLAGWRAAHRQRALGGLVRRTRR